MIISFKNKILILLLSVAAVMITGGLLTVYKTKKAFDTSAYWTEYTHNLILETQNVLSITQDIQLGGRGYVITGDSAFLEPVNHSTELVIRAVQKLKQLTPENPYQRAQIDSVDQMVHAIIKYVNHYSLIRQEKGFAEASKILKNGTGRYHLNLIRQILSRVRRTEYGLLKIRKDDNRKSIVVLNRIFFFLLSSQFIFLAIIFYIVRRNIEAKKLHEKNEIRFRSTLDKMLEGVEIIGFDYRYLYVNEAYEKQVKQTKDKLLGYTFIEKFPGVERTAIFQAIQRCFSERVVVHLEDSFTFPDKTTTWFEMSFQPISEGVFILSVDITEKKQAAEKVRQSEERFRSLIENSFDIVSIIDEDFIPIYRSPAAARVTGWTSNDVEKTGSIEQAHPDDLPKLKATLNNVVKNPGVPFPLSYRTRHKDGHYIFVEGIVTNLLQNESIKGIVSNFKDVTETHHAEERIRLSEQRFRSLIENSHDMVAIVDETFKPIYRSPSSSRITGYTDEERDGIDRRTQPIHPDDAEMLANAMKEVLRNPTVPAPLSFRIRHKQGHYIVVDGVMNNMIHNESIKGIVLNFRDVTEARDAENKVKESEKIYKTIASSIPGSVICLIDKDYRYFLIEGDMLESMGYSKEKLVGRKVPDVIPLKRYEEVGPLLTKAFHGQSLTVENPGSGVDTVSRYVPLKDEQGDVFAVMIVTFDVSELKKAQRIITELNVGLEHKIKERTLELETVNKELEAFSYSVAHDLRTPLRAILGYASLLAEDYSAKFDSEGKRMMKAVARNAKKMGTLVDDLLTFSRLGRSGIKKTLTNMKKITEISLQDINLGSEYHGEIKIGNLHSAMADSSLMKHVMINLLSNATKYSSKMDKPVIEISSSIDDDDIIYSIADNGVGFDMKYRDKLFGVFQRLHSDEEFEGTGVGLAIVERIIHKHNGKIWAKSEVNNGATFYFSLPIVPDTR